MRRRLVSVSQVRIAAWTLCTACLLIGGPTRAALLSDDEARRAIIDLRGKLELQTRETDKRFDELIARLERASRGQLELQNQIELLRQEVANLRGQLEVQTNELAKTQRQQRELITDVDSRVKRFEPVQVEIDGKTATVEPEELHQYEAALTQFRSGDFAPAIAAFEQFRKRWPGSAYTPNVLFWVGSGQYALKQYKASIATNEALLMRHPDYPRAADALLNIGFSQAESGERKSARKTLESVGTRFPGSQAAKLARERLATLR